MLGFSLASFKNIKLTKNCKNFRDNFWRNMVYSLCRNMVRAIPKLCQIELYSIGAWTSILIPNGMARVATQLKNIVCKIVLIKKTNIVWKVP